MNEQDERITLYTAADIQSIFQCGKKKAYEIMHIPGFPSFRIDTLIYVEKTEFEKWIAKNKCRSINTWAIHKYKAVRDFSNRFSL